MKKLLISLVLLVLLAAPINTTEERIKNCYVTRKGDLVCYA